MSNKPGSIQVEVDDTALMHRCRTGFVIGVNADHITLRAVGMRNDSRSGKLKQQGSHYFDRIIHLTKTDEDNVFKVSARDNDSESMDTQLADVALMALAWMMGNTRDRCDTLFTIDGQKALYSFRYSINYVETFLRMKIEDNPNGYVTVTTVNHGN